MSEGYASNPLHLARLQFAVPTSVHFLFVILTLGLVTLVAIIETRYVAGGRPELGRMARFWGFNAAVQLRGRANRRAGFDAVITGSGFVLAVGWGIVLAALLHGLPLTAGGRVTGFAHLFGPAGLLFGIMTGVLALVQGATFLGLPARRPFALIAAGLVVVVTLVEGLSLVLAGLLILALVVVALTRSLVVSSLAAALPVLIVGTAVFPDFLVSTVDPAGTATVAGGASGDHAVQVLTLAAVALLPMLVLAQALCWWYFRRRPSTVYW